MSSAATTTGALPMLVGGDHEHTRLATIAIAAHPKMVNVLQRRRDITTDLADAGAIAGSRIHNGSLPEG